MHGDGSIEYPYIITGDGNVGANFICCNNCNAFVSTDSKKETCPRCSCQEFSVIDTNEKEVEEIIQLGTRAVSDICKKHKNEKEAEYGKYTEFRTKLMAYYDMQREIHNRQDVEWFLLPIVSKMIDRSMKIMFESHGV